MDQQRVFEARHFKSMKDWVYFCVEFDLDICRGCQKRATRNQKTDGYREPYHCSECHPSLHPDLWTALASHRNTRTRCDLCGNTVEVKDCWISEDCQRLYCASHLRPLRVEDRYRITRQYLQRWHGPRYRPRKEAVEPLRRRNTSTVAQSPTRSGSEGASHPRKLHQNETPPIL